MLTPRAEILSSHNGDGVFCDNTTYSNLLSKERIKASPYEKFFRKHEGSSAEICKGLAPVAFTIELADRKWAAAF
jgi:hypothetical protein